MKHRLILPNLEWVVTALQTEIPCGGLADLAKDTGLKYTTLQTWREHLRQWSTCPPCGDTSGDWRRVFSDAEEEALMHRIRTKYLEKRFYDFDHDFHLDAMMFSEECGQRDRTANRAELERSRSGPMKPFLCSAQFAPDFRKRHKMSLRRPSLKRRPSSTPEQIDAFVECVRNLMKQYPLDRIINIDETNWSAVAAGFLTWAPAGPETMNCHIGISEKQGVTAIAAVTAAGEKSPRTVIAKGKTNRCLQAYGLPDGVWAFASESGWTTAEIIIECFRRLKNSPTFLQGL
jgi:hypothetical protein